MSRPEQKFVGTISHDKNTTYLTLPFLPDQVWGKKPVHHVTGFVGGRRYRGKICVVNDRPALLLGPAWSRDQPLSVGDQVEVVLSPEGPQRGELEADIAAALEKSPRAAAFFDGLAQFYRKGYLTWILATKKSPEERKRRIAETVRCLEAGLKERPKS